jgi:thioester reductase-like protein
LLEELFKTTNKKIYCIIRNKIKFEEYIKLFTNISYPNNRIIPVIGDITDKNLGVSDKIYKELINKVADIYHSAASVSFFCPWEKAKTINYLGTCNIIRFAEKSKSKLHHISTMSVSGDILTPQTVDYPRFKEENLYIGQLYKENVYSHSKYLAEKEIIKEIRLNRLNASIYRLPNLTWRAKDGVFQMNYYENDLYLMTKVMYELQLVPEELKDEDFLFTPVDDLAKAIVLISQKEKENNVFHFVSTESPSIGGYMSTLANIKYKPMNELYPILVDHSENASMQFLAMYLKGILNKTKEMIVHVESD